MPLVSEAGGLVRPKQTGKFLLHGLLSYSESRKRKRTAVIAGKKAALPASKELCPLGSASIKKES